MDGETIRTRMSAPKREPPTVDPMSGLPLERHNPHALAGGLSPEEAERLGVNVRDPFEVDREPDAPTRFQEMMALYRFGKKPFRD